MAQIPSAQHPTCISPGPAAAVASDRSSPSVLAPWNKDSSANPPQNPTMEMLNDVNGKTIENHVEQCWMKSLGFPFLL